MIKYIIIFLISFSLYSQEKHNENDVIYKNDSIFFSNSIKYIRVIQDFSLLTYNNKYGNKAPTIDISIAYIQSIPFNNNLYIDIFPEKDYAFNKKYK